MLTNVQAFLHQETDESWRVQAEPALTDYRREMTQRMPEGTNALSSCVEKEIQAWAAANHGAWADASRHAHEAARLAGNGGSSTAGYRAFWIYLEATWADQAAEEVGDGSGRAAAERLVRQAEQVIGLGSWVRQMAPIVSPNRQAWVNISFRHPSASVTYRESQSFA